MEGSSENGVATFRCFLWPRAPAFLRSPPRAHLLGGGQYRWPRGTLAHAQVRSPCPASAVLLSDVQYCHQTCGTVMCPHRPAHSARACRQKVPPNATRSSPTAAAMSSGAWAGSQDLWQLCHVTSGIHVRRPPDHGANGSGYGGSCASTLIRSASAPPKTCPASTWYPMIAPLGTPSLAAISGRAATGW